MNDTEATNTEVNNSAEDTDASQAKPKPHRTAVVFVHGQGEQRPMDSVRDLVNSVWATDPEIGACPLDPEDKNELRYWSVPDDRSDSYELHRLTTEPDEHGRRFDFYEFYWAHLVEGTSFGHVSAWFTRLFNRPAFQVPNPLLRIRQMVVRAFEMSIMFAIVTMAITLHLMADIVTGNSASFTEIEAGMRMFFFSRMETLAPYLALFAAPVLGALAIAGDLLRTTNAKEGGDPFQPLSIERNLMLVLTMVLIPLLGLELWGGSFLGGLKATLSVLIAVCILFWIARLLIAGVVLGVIGLGISFYILFAELVPEGQASTAVEFTTQHTLLFWVPMITAVASAGALILGEAAARLLRIQGSIRYLIAVGLSLASFGGCAWFLSGFYGLDRVISSQESLSIAAGWAIAMAPVLTVTARLNLCGLDQKKYPWRKGHVHQALFWFFIICAPFILLFDPAFRSPNDIEAFYLSDAMFGFTFLPMSAIVPLLYAAWWIYSQRYQIGRFNNKVSAELEPGLVRNKTSWFLLLITLVTWWSWSVYFHTSIGLDSSWPLYWLLTATALVIPTLVVVAVAANRAFLIPVMGDSARYLSPTPENISARHNIREKGVLLLEALHRDKNYDRVIVVAHSLGSVVAYDVLTQLWARRSDTHAGDVDRLALIGVENAARDLDMAIQNGEPESDVDALRSVFRKAQNQYARRLKLREVTNAKTGLNEPLWLVTDFVTLGSPLTYAQFLTSDSADIFKRSRDKLEFPACPCSDQAARKEIGLRGEETVFSYNKTFVDPETEEVSGRLAPKHSALFAAVRWTNLFFQTPGLVTGDLIGGEVSTNFGPGISERPIRDRPGKEGKKVAFAHNEYWKWFPNQARRSLPDRVSRKELRDANLIGSPPEHIKILREALKLSET
tara:strand:- start:2830 stop:5526 length:2697 start_codon:yes stop_codon:yes gene_type:complete